MREQAILDPCSQADRPVAERIEPVAPVQKCWGPIGGDVRPGADPGQERLDGVVIGEHLGGRAPHGALLRPLLGGGAGAGQLGERTRAGQPDRHRHLANLLPTHLEVARAALVVGRVEHAVHALIPQVVERTQRQPAEDPSPLPVRVGGGIDRPNRAERGAVWTAEPPAEEGAEADQRARVVLSDPGR